MKKSGSTILIAMITIASVMIIATSRVKAQQQTISFTAQLAAGSEIAPVVVSPTEAGANGTAIVTMVVTRSGSTITAATATFEVGVFGLASNSQVILAHIHEGASNVNGPVRVDSGLSPGSPLPAANGFVGFTRSGLTVTPALAQSIIDNPAGFYFNVHTVLSPGGVGRGQLVRQDSGGGSGAAAPTLSEWGAILMTLLFIAAGTFFLIGNRSAALAMATASVATGQRAIDWRLLLKTALCVEIIVAAVLIVVKAGPVDVMGALASGAIASFILTLLISRSRRE